MDRIFICRLGLFLFLHDIFRFRPFWISNNFQTAGVLGGSRIGHYLLLGNVEQENSGSQLRKKLKLSQVSDHLGIYFGNHHHRSSHIHSTGQR